MSYTIQSNSVLFFPPTAIMLFYGILNEESINTHTHIYGCVSKIRTQFKFIHAFNSIDSLESRLNGRISPLIWNPLVWLIEERC